MLGEIAQTKAQATKAAKASGEILAMLTNAESRDPLEVLSRLVEGVQEQRAALDRIEKRLTLIEKRLGVRS
jgi:hypothetical protein